jgi:hypothetical protein
MEELWPNIVGDWVDRLDGPFHFRFIVQPLVAVIIAILDGLRDARSGQPAYLWAVFTHPDQRRALLRDGWKSIGKVFVVAVLLDIIYQVMTQPTLRLVPMLVVAVLLAALPYALVRGPTNRFARALGS